MFIITMMCIERFLAITRPFIHREIVTAGTLSSQSVVDEMLSLTCHKFLDLPRRKPAI